MDLYRSGDRKSMATSAGIVEYRDIGSGAVVLFVHGAFFNGALWDDVAFYLPPGLRLVRPDLPLGGHRLPVAANADLSLPALAALILDFVEGLDLQRVILVVSDCGEAICRHLFTTNDCRTRRVDGLLFTNCDAFGETPLWHVAGTRIFNGEVVDDLGRALSTTDGRKAFFRRLAWTPLHDQHCRELLGGFPDNAAVRRDALQSLSSAGLPRSGPSAFDGPVKIVWGLEDRCLSSALGRQLVEIFPAAEWRPVEQARLLVPLDQPESLAEAVIDLLQQTDRRRRVP